MKYFLLQPEVAGGLGENTVMSTTVHPPLVSRLHYEFEGWLGDDLLESFPCHLVTARLRDALVEAGVSGCKFDTVEISKSDEFEEMYPDRELPRFFWLKVDGRPGVDDCGLTSKAQLVASERCLQIMKGFNLANCDTEIYV